MSKWELATLWYGGGKCRVSWVGDVLWWICFFSIFPGSLFERALGLKTRDLRTIGKVVTLIKKSSSIFFGKEEQVTYKLVCAPMAIGMSW